MTNCPCGTDKSYEECCGPFIKGTHIPKTPETLMRSRYTAFSQGEMAYILSTMSGEITRNFDEESSRQWAKQAKWLGLEVVNAPPVKPSDTVGYVEFKANFLLQDRKQNIHEISEFSFKDERWYYIGGKAPNGHHQERQKLGRNDPCPCGSQKKYKKCCGV